MELDEKFFAVLGAELTILAVVVIVSILTIMFRRGAEHIHERLISPPDEQSPDE